MKKLIILLLCAITFAGNAQGLFGRLKQAATDIVINKSQQMAERKLDKVTAPSKSSGTAIEQPGKQSATTNSKTEKSFKFYTHYDYVPGQAVFYADNFEGASIGELPVGWNSNGNGEVVTLNSIGGNWLKMNENATFYQLIKRLPVKISLLNSIWLPILLKVVTYCLNIVLA